MLGKKPEKEKFKTQDKQLPNQQLKIQSMLYVKGMLFQHRKVTRNSRKTRRQLFATWTLLREGRMRNISQFLTNAVYAFVNLRGTLFGSMRRRSTFRTNRVKLTLISIVAEALTVVALD